MSHKDAIIMTALSRYPDMPPREASGYISQASEAARPVCMALSGRADPDSLPLPQKRLYARYFVWASGRRARLPETPDAARRRKEIRMCLSVSDLYDRELISDEAMLMFGVSGEFPDLDTYRAMPPGDQEGLWADRLEGRFGPDWADWFGVKKTKGTVVGWKDNGF